MRKRKRLKHEKLTDVDHINRQTIYSDHILYWPLVQIS